MVNVTKHEVKTTKYWIDIPGMDRFSLSEEEAYKLVQQLTTALGGTYTVLRKADPDTVEQKASSVQFRPVGAFNLMDILKDLRDTAAKRQGRELPETCDGNECKQCSPSDCC